MTCCPRKTLQLALSAALTARRPRLVRHLLSSQGHHACALVIATWPMRQIADVLSILPRADQTEIFMRLSFKTRSRLLKMGIAGFEPAALNGKTSTFDRLKNLLLQAWPIRCWHAMASTHYKNHFGFAASQTTVNSNQQ